MTFSFFSNSFVFGVLQPVKIEGFSSTVKSNFSINFEYIFGNISFIVLFLAVLLYWFDFSDTQKISKKLKTFCMIGSNFALTCLLLIRWWESGHFPLSNLYESLIGLAWGFTAVHLFITLDFSINNYVQERSKMSAPQHFIKTRNIIEMSTGPLSDKVGAIIAPTALLTSVFANFFLPPEMLKTTSLIPALKSNWLTMHVTVMIISYAFLIIGSLLSIAFCAYRFALLYFNKNANFVNFTGLRKFVFPTAQGGAYCAGEAQHAPGGTAQAYATVTQGMVSTFQEQEKNSVLCESKRHQHDVISTYNYSNGVSSGLSHGSPDLVLQKTNFGQLDHGLVSKDFYQTKVQYDICVWLNTMSYRVLGLGFPLLTIGILSGAVWANEAWGSYWSWDPKETWALITWLVFAVYFHSRYNRSSDISPIPASIASFGFVVIWICYLGVNLLGSGLHSYGWFAFLSFSF